MTERQILLLYEAEIRRRERERVENLVDANMAFAGGKDAEQHVRGLQKKGP
ncbi:hypothetical protein WP8S17C03_22730 [Metapseudomonas otitidis]|uniref:Uncharacterized protein n=1 Tax=Metapseudomonas otitidis TaxID=319939 RepID=A0A6S5RT08_9GAMM|nr:hypothetical protein WP8S17C03_22730 [Pseudomonas otitidis]